MTTPHAWPIPEWIANLPDVERQAETTRFLLCLATVYLKSGARAHDLSRALGAKANQVHVWKARGQVSGEIAVAVEKLLGRDLFPREAFRPDLFLITGE